ncbi:MAG: sulfotransferase family 2 domain-containing protein, partial [Gammaproteobacteria bacterium]
MLISESKSFLFVHVQKTAGTSLAEILKPHALNPANGRMNKLASDLGLVRDWRKFHFRKHANLRKAQSVIPAPVYDGLFKFAFVRNPWDKLVSLYAYLERRRDLRAFMKAPEGAP